MKKIIAVVLMITLLLTGCSRESSQEDIVIIYTNDVHCAVEEGVGYEGLTVIKNTLLTQGNEVLLVDIGDAIQGDTIGTLSKGEYIIDLMNKVGYDIAVPGNHEFDYGMEQFLSLTEKAEFQYISANFVDKEGELVFDPYVIKEIGGRKIAFVGICTPQTLTSSTPTHFQNEDGQFIYGFCQDKTGEKLYQAVQTAVDDAEKEGAEIVIAVSHLGIEESCSPWMSTELIANTSGIDVVLDGHSHSVIESDVVENKEGEEVILTSTGTKLANVGCLTIFDDGKMSTKLINEGEVATAIENINTEFSDLLNKIVAKTDVDLIVNDPVVKDENGNSIRIIRNRETNLGNLVADAYRTVSGADIAFANGGGIRAEIPAGDITYEDIISVHPFGNMLCVVEATGQEILDTLEIGVLGLPGEDGSFQHVSGLTYEVDTTIPSGVKLDENGMFISVEGEYRVRNVKVAGEPLDVNKTYTLASHDYLIKNAGGGSNFFTDNTLLQDSVMLDNQVLITYIVDGLNGVVGQEYADPYGEGRIIIIE